MSSPALIPVHSCPLHAVPPQPLFYSPFPLTPDSPGLQVLPPSALVLSEAHKFLLEVNSAQSESPQISTPGRLGATQVHSKGQSHVREPWSVSPPWAVSFSPASLLHSLLGLQSSQTSIVSTPDSYPHCGYLTPFGFYLVWGGGTWNLNGLQTLLSGSDVCVICEKPWA